MKKMIFYIGIILIGGIIWYLFIKPYDYQVNFKAKTFPGPINQMIKTWSNTNNNSELLKSDKEDLLELRQQFQFGDSTQIYTWNIIPETDSTSNVKVYIKDFEHSIKNRLAILFTDTDFEKRTRKNLIDFNKLLNEHISQFKVKIIGEEELNSTYCACTTQTTNQFGKAKGMMKDYPLLDGFFVKNDLKLNGSPFLKIIHWDRVKDSVTFNFCYPIEKPEILPENPELTYLNLPPTKAIKAEYYGNYITSDRAWYALLDYAQDNNLKIKALPVEVFHNNPNMGGDALKWKTEVFLPLIK